MVNRRTFVTAAGATGSLLGVRALAAAAPKSVEPPVSRVASEFLHFDDPVDWPAMALSRLPTASSGSKTT